MREKAFLVRLIYRNELNLVKIEQIFCEGISFQVPDVYIYISACFAKIYNINRHPKKRLSDFF